MLDREPNLIVRDLVRADWDVSNTPLASSPRFHTGWYDYASSDPQVTFTNVEESTLDGGRTGVTAISGDGGTALIRAGTLLVNAWGGTRDDLRGAGSGGVDVNPKAAAYQMAREAARIIDANSGGTTDANGNPQLASLAADGAVSRVDPNPDKTVFRYEVTGRYTYAEQRT